MSTEVTLPELGENVSSGDLVKLLVKPGDHVEKDQPLLELETDKATVEVPSPSTGTVKEVHVREGEKLKVGQAILSLDGAENGAQRPQKRDAEPVEIESARAKGRRAPEATAAAKSAEPAQAAEEPSETGTPQSRSQAQLTGDEATGAESGSREPRQVTLPELGENVTAGDLVKVLVKVGDRIQKDQAIIELETDKATVEVPSPESGTVTEILARVGQKIKVGEPILTLSGGATAAARESKPADQQPKRVGETAMAKSAEPAEAAEEPADVAAPAAATKPPANVAMMPSPKRAGGRSPADVPAAPSVRQLAREIGVDITEVEGTGMGGRISFDDVKRHARESRTHAVAGGPAAAAQIPLPDFSKWGEIERQPMNAVRRATARQMQYAWAIPHVTQNDKADITALEKLRQRFSSRAERMGGKLTTTAVALKIVAGALKVFPKFAASIDVASEQVILKKYIHVGVAVDTERGLVVPVIRDVDKKNILEISVELAHAAEKARNRKLGPQDLEGGVFTITNLGGIGGTFFSPIINAPQVAILGIARAQMEPVYRPGADGAQGHFVPRMMLPLSLSYDHRIIDGADAARFLRWLAEAFEQPFLLSLEG
ncbi:MAG TPA: dihydrolipoyllysine-residue acetyltransferase [Terriglobales bacterium]|nr:dihydrolipoyllysine-residue acetyltransferase [Terriglobales bacterium]